MLIIQLYINMLKDQIKSNYSVLDSKIRYKKGVFIYVNNILDEIYSETNLVPMPGRSFLIGYSIGID